MSSSVSYFLPHFPDFLSPDFLCAVGEPINREAWEWFHRVVGGGRCPLVDTWWQTGEYHYGLTPLNTCLYTWLRPPERRRPVIGQ